MNKAVTVFSESKSAIVAAEPISKSFRKSLRRDDRKSEHLSPGALFLKLTHQF